MGIFSKLFVAVMAHIIRENADKRIKSYLIFFQLKIVDDAGYLGLVHTICPTCFDPHLTTIFPPFNEEFSVVMNLRK